MASRNYNTVLIADHIVLNGPDYTSKRTPREIVEQMGGIFVEGPLDPNATYPAGKTVYSYQPDLTPAQITEAVGEGQFNGAIVAAKAVKPKPGKEKIDGKPFLDFAVRIGAGTNNVEEVSKAGGVIMNTPGFNSEPTANAIVSAFNNVLSPDEYKVTNKPHDFYRQTNDVLIGKADSNNLKPYNHGDTLQFEGTKPGPKKVAIIGPGHIGGLVAKSLSADGHSVTGYSRSLTPEGAEKLGMDYAASLLEAVKDADVIIVQTPLTDATKNLINKAVLEAAKPGVVLINAARSGVVEKEALKWGMETGHIGGLVADLDHFAQNSPMQDSIEAYRAGVQSSQFQANDRRVILTPHTFADTHSPSREAGAMQAIRQAFRALHIINSNGAFKEPFINHVGSTAAFKAVEDGCKPETLHPTIAAATGAGLKEAHETSVPYMKGIAGRPLC